MMLFTTSLLLSKLGACLLQTMVCAASCGVSDAQLAIKTVSLSLEHLNCLLPSQSSRWYYLYHDSPYCTQHRQQHAQDCFGMRIQQWEDGGASQPYVHGHFDVWFHLCMKTKLSCCFMLLQEWFEVFLVGMESDLWPPESQLLWQGNTTHAASFKLASLDAALNKFLAVSYCFGSIGNQYLASTLRFSITVSMVSPLFTLLDC